MRPTVARVMATAALVLASGLAHGATVVTAVRTGQAPQIDGKLDDAVWTSGKPCTEFVINGTADRPKLGTRAVVLFDDAALYIGVRCEDPNVAGIKTERLTRDSGDVFRCDCVEIMLDPTLSRNDYFHFGINASGVVADRACTQGGFIGDMAWDAEVTAASFVGDTYWSCEMMVPFFSLGITPAVKSSWGINVCREKRQPEELSSIAERGAFNNAGSFAELRGLDVDFSRYCFEIGTAVTALQVREGGLDVDVSVPVRNASGQARRALLECWLISPTEQVATASTVVDLPAGAAATYPVGRVTVRDQGDYACGIRVADPATKKPLAYRGTRLPLAYVPMSIRLIEPWYRQAIFLQCSNISPDCLLNIHNRLFLRLSLADAARQTWTFCHPITIFTGV